MSNRKWLKWQVGSGVIFSLAVMFNTAKADPEFVKAIQAAQDTSNASDMDDEENRNDQENAYTDGDSVHSDKEIKSSSELALTKEEPQKHSRAITPPPVLAETKKSNAEAHGVDHPKKKLASSKKQPTHKQISKQDSVTSAPAVSKSLKAANTQTTQQPIKHSQPASVPANNQVPAPAAEPPADIPVVPPTEDTSAAPTASIAVNARPDENTDQSQTETTSTKKTSHSKSHHS